jgi:hypothetical protein
MTSTAAPTGSSTVSTARHANGTTTATTTASGAADLANPAFQAFWLMRIGFTVAPIVFGLDKFTDWLTNWDKYLAPQFSDWAHLQPHTAMLIVGVIEIVAGVVVFVVPKFGGYLVAVWLAAIIVNLAVIGGYWDIALRDFGLLLAALALARLASAFPAFPAFPAFATSRPS